MLQELERDIRMKSINKSINANWVSRCGEIDNDNAKLFQHEEMTFNYYKLLNLNRKMQKIHNDLPQEIELYTEYEILGSTK
jgi:hypothetical protein